MWLEVNYLRKGQGIKSKIVIEKIRRSGIKGVPGERKEGTESFVLTRLNKNRLALREGAMHVRHFITQRSQQSLFAINFAESRWPSEHIIAL